MIITRISVCHHKVSVQAETRGPSELVKPPCVRLPTDCFMSWTEVYGGGVRGWWRGGALLWLPDPLSGPCPFIYRDAIQWCYKWREAILGQLYNEDKQWDCLTIFEKLWISQWLKNCYSCGYIHYISTSPNCGTCSIRSTLLQSIAEVIKTSKLDVWFIVNVTSEVLKSEVANVEYINWTASEYSWLMPQTPLHQH